MPIDTTAEKKSLIGMGKFFRPALPHPDGLISSGEQQVLSWLYYDATGEDEAAKDEADNRRHRTFFLFNNH